MIVISSDTPDIMVIAVDWGEGNDGGNDGDLYHGNSSFITVV